MTNQIQPRNVNNNQFSVFFSQKPTAFVSSMGLFSVCVVSALGAISTKSTANKVGLASLSLLAGAFSLGCYSIHLIDRSIKKLTDERQLFFGELKA